MAVHPVALAPRSGRCRSQIRIQHPAQAASPATVAAASVQPGRTGRTASAPATVTCGAAVPAASRLSALSVALSGSTTMMFPGSRVSSPSCPGLSR